MYRRPSKRDNRVDLIFGVGRPDPNFSTPVFVILAIVFFLGFAAVVFGIVIAVTHSSAGDQAVVVKNATATESPTAAATTPPPPFVTVIPLPTLTNTATATVSASVTQTSSATLSLTATSIPTPTASATAAASPTVSASSTSTVTLTATESPTVSASPTAQPTPPPPSCNSNPFTGFTNLARITLSADIPSIAGGAFGSNPLIQPLTIWNESQGIPFSTNRWWQNLVLNSTADTDPRSMFTAAAYALPYLVVTASAGLQVSYPGNGFNSLRWAPWVCVGASLFNTSNTAVCPVYSTDSPPDCAAECANVVVGGGVATTNTPHYWAWKPFGARLNTANNFTVELGLLNDTGALTRVVSNVRDFFTFDMFWDLQDSGRGAATILLRGAPYTTMGYNNSVPIIKGITGLQNGSLCCGFKAVRKLRNGSLYELDFEHTWNDSAQLLNQRQNYADYNPEITLNQTWALFASPPLDLVANASEGGALVANSIYNGTLRLALLRSGSENASVALQRLAVLERHTADIVRQTFIFSNTSEDGQTANIAFLWATNTQNPPLMCNLPQHRTDFDDSRVNATLLHYDSLWGQMQCVVGCNWLMREPLYDFDYFSPCELDPSLSNLTASFLNSSMQPVINASSGQQTAPGVFQDVDGSEELYQYGKRVSKIATLLLAAEQTGYWQLFATPLVNQPDNLPNLPLPALQTLLDFVLNGTASDTFCSNSTVSSFLLSSVTEAAAAGSGLRPCNADEEELMKLMPSLAEVIQQLSHCVPTLQWQALIASTSFETTTASELGQCDNSDGYSDCVVVECMPGNPNLLYDITWGGLVSNISLNDPATLTGSNFGNAIYNDHHFWYGYFVYALAVVGRYDPLWLQQRVNGSYDLMRDYANPNTNDPFFPFFRHKDWFTYNSWDLGLISSSDGRSQQSASEALHAYYAMQLIGLALNNSNLANLGRVLVAMEAAIAASVYRPSANMEVGLPAFVTNQTLFGTVSELAVSQGSYYGSSLETTQGIQFLPWTPATQLLYNNNPDFINDNQALLLQLMSIDQPLGFPLFPANYSRVMVGEYSLFQPNVDWVSHLYQALGVVDRESAVAALTNSTIIDWNSSSVRTGSANNGNTLPAALIWIGTRPDPISGECTPAPVPPALSIPGALFLRGIANSTTSGSLTFEMGSGAGNRSLLVIPSNNATSVEAPPTNNSLLLNWTTVHAVSASGGDSENPVGEILLWLQSKSSAVLRVRTNYDFDGDGSFDFWNDCDFQLTAATTSEIQLQRVWSKDSSFLGCCSSDPGIGCSDSPPSSASSSISAGSISLQLWIKSSSIQQESSLEVISDSSAAYGSYSYATTYFGMALHAV